MLCLSSEEEAWTEFSDFTSPAVWHIGDDDSETLVTVQLDFFFFFLFTAFTHHEGIESN